MKEVTCPICGGHNVYHYTDAYVVRRPRFEDDGAIQLVELETVEYDDCFFECTDCGARPSESELTSGQVSEGGVTVASYAVELRGVTVRHGRT
jgi:hypothetical protein